MSKDRPRSEGVEEAPPENYMGANRLAKSTKRMSELTPEELVERNRVTMLRNEKAARQLLKSKPGRDMT